MNCLKDKNIRRLMFGSVTSQFGSNMQQFALSLYVLAITGSAGLFASLLAIAILPRIFLAPIAGVIGDWIDRKKSIVRLDLLNAVIIAVYAVYFSINGSLSLKSIYLLVILLEITEVFFSASMSAVVPSMVPKEALFDINRVRTAIASFSNIAAPLLAATLYGFLGLRILLIVNAVSFFVSAICEMTIDIPKTNSVPEKVDFKVFKRDFLEGATLVKTQPMLRRIIGLGIILNFSISALFSVGLIYILIEVLDISEAAYGLVSTLLATSMFLGPLLLGGVAKKVKVGRLTIMTFAVLDLLVFGLAFATSKGFLTQFQTSAVPLVIVFAIAFITGMLSSVNNIALSTLFQTLIPLTHMSRASSFMNLALLISMPLGQLLFGFALDTLAPSTVILITAFIVLAGVVFYYKPFVHDEPEKILPTSV